MLCQGTVKELAVYQFICTANNAVATSGKYHNIKPVFVPGAMCIKYELNFKLHTQVPCLRVQNGRQASVQNHPVASLQALAAQAPAVTIQRINTQEHASSLLSYT